MDYQRGGMMPKFSKMHYNAIAKVLGETAPIDGDKMSLAYSIARQQWSTDAGALMDYFQDDNTMFDADKFLESVQKHITRRVNENAEG